MIQRKQRNLRKPTDDTTKTSESNKIEETTPRKSILLKRIIEISKK